MRILVSGSSGLIASALIPLLRASEHTVLKLVRRKDASATDEVVWDPSSGFIEQELLEGFDAVVHLAAENIADGRWSAAKKQKLRQSRLAGTTLLSSTLAKCKRPPKTLISASAIGFYGDRGDEICTEDSAAGRGFLAALVQDWEAATSPASSAGIRVVTPRIGLVLSARGGALDKMLLPFKLGLGGKLGSGRQYMSWIELGDLARLLYALIEDASVRGPVNCVAPQPVRNSEFTKALGKSLRRPALFAVPAPLLRLVLGELADEALLSSTRVSSTRMPNKFVFEFPELAAAFEHILHQQSPIKPI